MTTEQIVKALRVCGTQNDCIGCECEFSTGCFDRLKVDASNLIEQQAAKIKELEREANRYATADEHEKLEKLVDDLKDIVRRRHLVTLNGDDLAEEVKKNSDVEWCLSELRDILEALDNHNCPFRANKRTSEPCCEYVYCQYRNEIKPIIMASGTTVYAPQERSLKSMSNGRHRELAPEEVLAAIYNCKVDNCCQCEYLHHGENCMDELLDDAAGVIVRLRDALEAKEEKT